MGKPRIVARGATYAITRRTVFRKAFLGWWSKEVDDIWFWCLALACEKCGVVLHHAVRVGSHYHLTITCLEENLGEFLWWLNHSMSRALNALLEKEGYDAPGQLFDGRQTHVMRLMDAEAQMVSLVYERLNPPKAGLSETCDGIPGKTLPPAMWKSGTGLELERPSVYFASGPTRRRVRTEPQPLLYLAFGGDVDALVHHLNKLEREGERAIRRARDGRPARTLEEVRAIHPCDEPRTPREAGGGRVPCFKTGLGPLAQMKGAVEVTGWRKQYRAARKRWEGGDRDGQFPHGTYEMRRSHGAEVAEPAPDAWVSAPGVTLEEAKAMVATGAAQRDEDLVNRVRETVMESLDELLRDEPAERPDPEAAAEPKVVNVARPGAVTVHGFANRRRYGCEEDPRRLIRLRDHWRRVGRRGQPPPRP